MHEAVDVVGELDKGAEAGELGDLAVDEIADLVALVDLLPRIVFELLDAEAMRWLALSMSMTTASIRRPS